MTVFSYSKQLDAERCILAHGLNNDLTTILCRCDLLGDLLLANTEAAKQLRIIQVLAHRMADRIAVQLFPARGVNGLRDLAKVVV